jgi:hypothetical protein
VSFEYAMTTNKISWLLSFKPLPLRDVQNRRKAAYIHVLLFRETTNPNKSSTVVSPKSEVLGERERSSGTAFPKFIEGSSLCFSDLASDYCHNPES